MKEIVILKNVKFYLPCSELTKVQVFQLFSLRQWMLTHKEGTDWNVEAYG